MVIDFRCRPPTDYFLQYFDAPRVGWMAARLGAPQLSPAFLKGSMELFWEEMDEAGIDIGVVLGRNSPAVFMGKPFKEAFIPNEHIAELVAKYPGRLIGFGGIDASNTRHNAVDETVRCVEKLGLKGIFVEPGRQLLSHPADERLNPLYEACIGLDVPVIVMSGPYAGADIGASHPTQVDQLATRHPALKIVLGHGAWPWIEQTLGVAFKHPNVFVSPDIYFFAPGSAGYVDAMNGVLADQFLFATAYPLRPLGQTVSDCRKFPRSNHVADKFFFANARKLLGLA
jgi:predicted TIM-barrel fold metal-dependent hydrolase